MTRRHWRHLRHTHTHTHVELLMTPLAGNNVVFDSFSALSIYFLHRIVLGGKTEVNLAEFLAILEVEVECLS